jgi:hypothetical protein
VHQQCRRNRQQQLHGNARVVHLQQQQRRQQNQKQQQQQQVLRCDNKHHILKQLHALLQEAQHFGAASTATYGLICGSTCVTAAQCFKVNPGTIQPRTRHDDAIVVNTD